MKKWMCLLKNKPNKERFGWERRYVVIKEKERMLRLKIAVRRELRKRLLDPVTERQREREEEVGRDGYTGG